MTFSSLSDIRDYDKKIRDTSNIEYIYYLTFLAIINDTYGEVKADIKTRKNHQEKYYM